jgi:catechol 2,3-dioxygenase-like lactoylglutathione lyase family enzyme
MNRWSGSLLRVVFAFVIVFLAGIVSVSVSAVSHSHSGLLSGIAFFAAFMCLSFFLQRALPSLYSDWKRPRPWWQTRAAEAPIAIAFALIVSILSSRIATLWFGLLAISAVLVALLLRVTAGNRESVDLLAQAASGTVGHIHVPEHIHPQLPLKSQRHERKEETFRPTDNWAKPPFSIPDNSSIDARNLTALRDWYKEKLGLRDVYDEREDDSGRPFADLHIANSEASLSLIELPVGATTENGHVIFFAKNLEKAHRWLTKRGVLVEPITTDSGGNRLFRFRDLEGNAIEVCVEPR